MTCCALQLAVGLGLGLSRNSGNSGRHGGSTDFPGWQISSNVTVPGQDDSRSGMLESGVYLTTYSDAGSKFAWTAESINFNSANSGSVPNADLILHPSSIGVTMEGFGAAMTDASASLLLGLKAQDPEQYRRTMRFLFNRRNGLSILRVPIGTTDFSPESLQYTFADHRGSVAESAADPTFSALFSNFNTSGAGVYLFPVLRDALKINPDLKLALLPWSPPAYLKDNDSVNAGSLISGAADALARYLTMSIQAFAQELNISPWAVSVQNEPTNPTTYPSMAMNNDVEARVLLTLRANLQSTPGLSGVKLMGHEDNFIGYESAALLVRANASNVDGVAFHCYNGSFALQSNFTSSVGTAGVGKLRMMSECSGQDTGNDAQVDVPSYRWWMENIFLPLTYADFAAFTVWNIATDPDYGPHLQRAVCQNCVGVLTIDNHAPGANGTAASTIGANLQSILLSHFAVATTNLTRLGGGPSSRIGVDVKQNQPYSQCIVPRGFAAPWQRQQQGSNSTQSSGQTRYGLVVQNTCGQDRQLNVALGSGVTSLTFPVGVSTYVWTT